MLFMILRVWLIDNPNQENEFLTHFPRFIVAQINAEVFSVHCLKFLNVGVCKHDYR